MSGEAAEAKPIPRLVADQRPRASACLAEAVCAAAFTLSTLRDCDYGDWRGSSFDKVSARDPVAVSKWLSDPAATPHGGESLLSLIERVGEWLEGESAMNRRSIVVTHPTIIRAAIVHAIEAPPKSFWRIDIAPLSITRLSGTGGRWSLMATGGAMSDLSLD
jgi:broad specificity phosphatase PhoE